MVLVIFSHDDNFLFIFWISSSSNLVGYIYFYYILISFFFFFIGAIFLTGIGKSTLNFKRKTNMVGCFCIHGSFSFLPTF